MDRIRNIPQRLRLAIPIIIFCFLGIGCTTSQNSLQVMAASSLTEAFEEIADEFEKENQIKVTLTIAGSTSLASQLEDGAKIDVIALADLETMERVIQAGRVSKNDLRIFATNHLVLATPLENPGNIYDLNDLENSVTAICAKQVPYGKLSFQLALQKGVKLHPSTFEPNVRSVRTKIELGEVDAGLIYITDINKKINHSLISGAEKVQTEYPVAITTDSKQESVNFVEFVLSPTGQKILRQYRFGGPE